MDFLVGMFAGMLLLWAARTAWRQSRLDGWQHLHRNSRHLRRFYDARDRERQSQG